MKKKLVVLLAVVMMFAFAATAYAVDFSDISEQPVTVQDAIAKTTALGIIEGYTDGTFGPEQNITRAEFAKIAVTAAGAKDTAAMLEKNASSFKDVKAGVWYTGWINASESLGIFQGDGNGNFRPNDSISNQEVVTVLMRLLGYNDNLTGTWPTNYITQANKIGILDDVAIVAAAAAKRGDVVVMLDDTLDSNIVTYDKDTNEFVEKQKGVGDSFQDGKTLLDDSFDGAFVEYTSFTKVDQVRDAAAETLTWNVGSVKGTKNAPYDALIIDKDTKVSHNAASIFDLENHQGKVYYVKDGSKYYARFIEVKSYTKTTSDEIKAEDFTRDSKGNVTKAKSGKTSYNVAAGIDENDIITKSAKNSNFVLYFNSDDQLYRAVSDQTFPEQAYYVKTVGTATVKLVNNDKTVTRNMKDGETLIWNGKEFIAPSELKVGDAVMEITADDLYTTVAEATGELTKTNDSNASQRKATIGGKTYVYSQNKYFDDKFDDANIEDDDVLGNNVKYILNKNNSIAAIIVDETSTGTKLYGIVVEGSKKGDSNGLTTDKDSEGELKNLTIFTAEGKEVTYDLDLSKDYGAKEKEELSKPEVILGRMVEYQLNKDGDIKELKLLAPDITATGVEAIHKGGTNLLKDEKGTAVTDVEVKNNSYLKAGTTITLASNVVIFEVGEDDGYIDPSLVTRAQLLAGGDFTPKTLGGDDADTKIKGLKGTALDGQIAPYAVYVANSNGAAKALAYTSGDASRLNFAVIDSYRFHNSDGDDNLTFKGDDTVYEWTRGKNEDGTSGTDSTTYDGLLGKGGDGKLVVYTLSGSKVDIREAYDKKDAIKGMTKVVNGWADGLMTFKDKFEPDFYDGNRNSGTAVYNIMTDVDTQVYVINSSNGNYDKGSVEDISKGSYVFVVAMDEDNVAELVIVDEYTDYTKYNASVAIKAENDDVVKVDVDGKGTDVTITFKSTVENIDTINTYAKLETYVTLPENAMINGDARDEATITDPMEVVITPDNGGEKITCTVDFVFYKPATKD